MSSHNSNKQAKLELEAMYGCHCMLTYIQTKKLEFHHIEKKEYGGPATADNGALLITQAHRWLHYLETTNYPLFLLVNDVLLCFKLALDSDNEEIIQDYEQEILPRFQQEIQRYTYQHSKKRRH